MQQHSFVLHSPKEMRRLSNLGHIIEDELFATVGLLAFLGKLSGFTYAFIVHIDHAD